MSNSSVLGTFFTCLSSLGGKGWQWYLVAMLAVGLLLDYGGADGKAGLVTKILAGTGQWPDKV